MSSRFTTRWLIVFAVIVVGSLWMAPNFVEFSKDSVLGKSKMNLGLDIQGGLHLVLGVDVDQVVRERVTRQAENLRAQFQENGMAVSSSTVDSKKYDEINLTLANEGAKAEVLKYLDEQYGTTLQVLKSEGTLIVLRFFDARTLEMKKEVVGQAIEVIRNRIDEFGVSEPSIVAQGADRILVQLPGLKDAVKAKESINRTAKLDFRIVSAEPRIEDVQSWIVEAETKGSYKLGTDGLSYQAYVNRLNADLKDKLPKDTRIVFEKMENADSLEAGRRPFVVKTDLGLGGNLLEDASVGSDDMGKPQVNFRFGIEGRKLFAELTRKAAGGFLAIVLDDVVKSAPSVREEIDSDSARITLGSTRDYQAALDEASFIARSLRAGALPVGIQQLEERTVGASLGADSIKKGKYATMIGSIGVVLFMLFFYGKAGLIADIALALNLFLTIAILSSLGATLTLPGVAGFALTIGMAVDANVIVFERIKEELAKGAAEVAAIRDGFSNAFSAIFDSNLTTVLTCIVLIYYGTGPIRGFAVSLSIGIAVSMFTALFVSRLLIDTMVIKFKWNVFKASKAGRHVV